LLLPLEVRRLLLETGLEVSALDGAVANVDEQLSRIAEGEETTRT
jgi:hypothetical protein